MYFIPNKIRIMKPRRIRLAGNIARMGDMWDANIKMDIRERE